jgi:hypothetical protein
MIMIFLMSVRLGMAWGGFLEGETTNAEPARDKPVRLIAQGFWLGVLNRTSKS